MTTTTKSPITVLMSTYNGERFLREQMDSILKQQDVDVRVLVRDDGSKDNTLPILEDYRQCGQADYYTGPNMGPAYSFLDLLRQAPDSDYYAFADQDDVWLSDKLCIAVRHLQEAADQPALYFSRTQLVDEHLSPLPHHLSPLNPYLTFGESLIYEFIPGCTMVMNRALRDIVNTYRPDYLPMHDVWIYSIALAVGARIFFDGEPHMLYRQHGANTIGQGYSIWHEWSRRWQRISSNEQSRSRRAQELRKGFPDYITPENLSLLDDFIRGKHSLLQRAKLLTDHRLRCASLPTQRLFWVNLLINKY